MFIHLCTNVHTDSYTFNFLQMAVVLQRYLARQRHKSALNFALTAEQPSDTRVLH